MGYASGTSILLVDDEETVRTFFTHVLEAEGHRVVCAATAGEALERLEESAPSIVLLDINLPDMNGYEVLERMRDNPSWSALPVLMVSGMSEVECVARCARMGVAGYMMKPVDASLLRERVRQVARVNGAVLPPESGVSEASA